MSDARAYDELVMDHIRNARNYRVLDNASQTTTGSNPLCGDEMTVYLRMNDDEIAEVTFQCTCCGISMASASIMTDSVQGKTRAEATALVRRFIELIELIETRSSPDARSVSAELTAILDTVARFPARKRCATLAWTTLDESLRA